MENIKVVKNFSDDYSIKYWKCCKNTRGIRFETMFSLSIISIIFQSVQIIDCSDIYNNENAEIIVRTNQVKVNQDSIVDVWDSLGFHLVSKVIDNPDLITVRMTYEYITNKIIPLIYNEHIYDYLTKEQLRICKFIDDINEAYESRFTKHNDLTSALIVTNKAVRCIITSIYDAYSHPLKRLFLPSVDSCQMLKVLYGKLQ